MKTLKSFRKNAIVQKTCYRSYLVVQALLGKRLWILSLGKRYWTYAVMRTPSDANHSTHATEETPSNTCHRSRAFARTSSSRKTVIKNISKCMLYRTNAIGNNHWANANGQMVLDARHPTLTIPRMPSKKRHQTHAIAQALSHERHRPKTIIVHISSYKRYWANACG